MRRICAPWVPHEIGARWRSQHKKIVSPSHVETFNSKLIKRFRTWTRSRYVFSNFESPMFYRYEHYMSISHMALIVAIVQWKLSLFNETVHFYSTIANTQVRSQGKPLLFNKMNKFEKLKCHQFARRINFIVERLNNSANNLLIFSHVYKTIISEELNFQNSIHLQTITRIDGFDDNGRFYLVISFCTVHIIIHQYMIWFLISICLCTYDVCYNRTADRANTSLVTIIVKE